jgi:hypothetical protein
MRLLPIGLLLLGMVVGLAPGGLAQSSSRIYVPIAGRNVVGLEGSVSTAATATPQMAATATPTVAATTATPTTVAARIDLARLPRGDQKQTTTTPQVGYIYLCSAETYAAPTTTFPWVDYAANTWNLNTKVTVDGSVSWSSSFSPATSGTTRTITSNGLPSHTSGSFPIASSDDASLYDRNPGSIAAQSYSYSLPKSPTANSSPACLRTGAIGIMLTGPVFFNGTDAAAADAPAKEIQDACGGHPAGTTYHYHLLSPCVSDPGTSHSALMGYAFDGFGIYGHRGESGETLINADLDVCHGHTHTITWDGVSASMFHYHATYEYPYTLGCYRGTSAVGVGTPAKPGSAASWRTR